MSEGSEQEQQRLIAGRYRLRGVLGQGAMGKVWEAHDEDLRRSVAVKEILLADGLPSAQADELRERTMREARATAMLSHPNVVTLYDVVRENGDPFVVMELVRGRSLASLLRERGRLTVPQAAAVAEAVASALQAAHTAGITHRDVKPGNVLVADDGRVKLTDFGIARNMAEQTLTTTGMMLGSPAYIAPEVAAGKGVSPSADLWGLGATLFAVVEGRPPYNSDLDVLQTLYQVVYGDVPRPRSTGPLADVVIGLMTRAVEARMSLVEVRRRIYPLLPEPGQSVFTEPSGNTSTPAGDRRTDTLPSPRQDGPPPPPFPPRTTTMPAQVALGHLATNPGPLPFTPSPQPPAPAGHGLHWAVTVAAVLLFVLSATAGFAATRELAGQAVLPVTSQQGTTEEQVTLVPRTARAAPPIGPGGEFTISVPEDWPMFVEQRVADSGLSASTKMHFVSPDGRFALVVERFLRFYPRSKVSEYVAVRSKELGGVAFDFRTAPVHQAGSEPAAELRYRTALVPGGNHRRYTVGHAIPLGKEDLWVVSVTGPIEEEQRIEEELYRRIEPTFSVTT